MDRKRCRGRSCRSRSRHAAPRGRDNWRDASCRRLRGSSAPASDCRDGLNGIVGMAMLIPFTYNLDEYTAFALLLGMAAVITSSDFITAVLFGVPGHVGAAATVIDGHAMARKGEAGRAFGAGFAASLAGGIVGAIVLAVSIPILRPVMLSIGSPELLAFTLFGMSMVATLSGRAPLKGLTAAGLGLMIAMIGSRAQNGTLRWTFGWLYLWDGMPLIPATLGIFALPDSPSSRCRASASPARCR